MLDLWPTRQEFFTLKNFYSRLLRWLNFFYIPETPLNEEAENQPDQETPGNENEENGVVDEEEEESLTEDGAAEVPVEEEETIHSELWRSLGIFKDIHSEAS